MFLKIIIGVKDDWGKKYIEEYFWIKGRFGFNFIVFIGWGGVRWKVNFS